MEKLELAAEPRKASNKGVARRLRMAGKIPAVLYGVGESQTLAIEERDWKRNFRYVSANVLITLAVGKKKHNVLLKDKQESIILDRVNHLDFYEVEAGKILHVEIPIHFDGSPMGVREGGILEHKVETIEVSCLPKDMPRSFVIDISPLEIGDSLHVKDLPSIDGVEIKNDPIQTLVVVSHPKAVVEEEEEVEEGDEEVDAGEVEEE